MAKGGARTGAGRKKNPAKDLAPVGERTAVQFLDSLGKEPAPKWNVDTAHKKGHVEEMRRLYYDARRSGHYWVAASIIFKNREWAYGKAIQKIQLANQPGKKFEVDVTSSARDKLAALLG